VRRDGEREAQHNGSDQSIVHIRFSFRPDSTALKPDAGSALTTRAAGTGYCI
jgi:hypothetical protein